MSGFEDREKGFEAKYSHDEAQTFKIRARRNRLLGEWAAGKIGLSGDAVAAYARQCMEADFTEPGENDVVEKLKKDFAAHKAEVSEHQIRREMERLLETARAQIMAEGK